MLIKNLKTSRKEQGFFGSTSPDQSWKDLTTSVNPFGELISGGRIVLGLNILEQGRATKVTTTKVK